MASAVAEYGVSFLDNASAYVNESSDSPKNFEGFEITQVMQNLDLSGLYEVHAYIAPALPAAVINDEVPAALALRLLEWLRSRIF